MVGMAGKVRKGNISPHELVRCRPEEVGRVEGGMGGRWDGWDDGIVVGWWSWCGGRQICTPYTCMRGRCVRPRFREVLTHCLTFALIRLLGVVV
jgi:hypothetical protein